MNMNKIIKNNLLLKRKHGILLSVILVSTLQERKNIQLLSNKLIDQISKNNLTGLVEIISHMSTSQPVLEDMILTSGGNFFMTLDKKDSDIEIDLNKIITNLRENFTREYFKTNFQDKEFIIYKRKKIISKNFNFQYLY